METARQLDKPFLGTNDAAKDKAINERDAMTQDTPYPDPVSYTHLTLPTNREV